MYANPPGVEFQETIFKFINRNKIPSLHVYVLHKRRNKAFSRCQRRNVQKRVMHVQSCCKFCSLNLFFFFWVFVAVRVVGWLSPYWPLFFLVTRDSPRSLCGSCSSCSEEKSPMVPNPDPNQYWNNWKNDMSLFSTTNQERPCGQLLHNWSLLKLTRSIFFPRFFLSQVFFFNLLFEVLSRTCWDSQWVRKLLKWPLSLYGTRVLKIKSNQILFKLDSVRSGCPISRARGSCIKRSSIPDRIGI